MSKDKNKKKIQTVDKTEGNGKDADVVAQVLANLTDEQKAQLAAQLGVRPKKKGEGKEALNCAITALFEAMPTVQKILENVKFPGAFSVTVGIDPDGFMFAEYARVRSKYGKRGAKKEGEAAAEQPPATN